MFDHDIATKLNALKQQVVIARRAALRWKIGARWYRQRVKDTERLGLREINRLHARLGETERLAALVTELETELARRERQLLDVIRHCREKHGK